MSKLSWMDSSGHSQIEWSVDDAKSVEDARAQFDALIEQNYGIAYKGGLGGAPAEQIREFDPTAEDILFTPQMMGG